MFLIQAAVARKMQIMNGVVNQLGKAFSTLRNQRILVLKGVRHYPARAW